MKIVIAPDSFKESLTSKEVSEIIKEGFESVFPKAEYCCVEMADGGEGTLDTLILETKGRVVWANVVSPTGSTIKTYYGILGDGKTVAIEMAKASGIGLVHHKDRRTIKATTRGTGQLIKNALKMGFRKFIISVGGSATSDCGIGALSELGVSFLNKQNREVSLCGAGLNDIESIDISKLDKRVLESEFIVACDVDSPLLGKSGSVNVYSKQKGATFSDLRELTIGFENFASKVKEFLDVDVNIPMAGAAGGLAAGLHVFLSAKLECGGSLIAKMVKLEEKMDGASLVITGEGGINYQTINGKTPICVAEIAKKKNLPVIAIAGNLGRGFESVYDHGIDAAFSISPGVISRRNSMKYVRELLLAASFRIANTLKIGKKI